MKKIILFLVLLCSPTLDAGIDCTHLKGTHDIFKSEYQVISPVAAFLAHDIFTENLRMRGHYGPKTTFDPHPQLTNTQKASDSPQDPVAKLFQFIYPSPAREELTPAPKRPEDYFGAMTLSQLGRIITYVALHRQNLVEDDLIVNIFGTSNKSVAKLLRGTKKFRQRMIAQMIIDAFTYQDQTKIYPPYAIEHALMGMLFYKAENRADVRELLTSMSPLLREGALTVWDTDPYDKTDWLKARSAVNENPQFYLTPETAMLVLGGDIFFNENRIPLVRQGYVWFDVPNENDTTDTISAKRSYSNCGESALNCLFNFLFYSPQTQTFDVGPLISHAETLEVSFSPGLINFFKSFNTPAEMRKKEVLQIWADLVSGLDDVSYNKPSTKPFCDIQSYPANHMTVISKLVLDTTLSTLAEEARTQYAVVVTPNENEAKESALSKLNQTTERFWARLCEIFSTPDHLFSAVESDKTFHSSEQHRKSIYALSRSDLNGFAAEYRVMNTHAKFLLNKSKGGLFGNNDGDESDEESDSSDDNENDFDESHGIVPVDDLLLGSLDFLDTLTLHYLSSNQVNLLKVDFENIDELLSKCFASETNFGQFFFSNFFWEDSFDMLFEAALKHNRTSFFPFIKRKIDQEIAAEHGEFMIMCAEFQLRYPNSFLSSYDCLKKITDHAKESSENRSNLFHEIRGNNYVNLLTYLGKMRLVDMNLYHQWVFDIAQEDYDDIPVDSDLFFSSEDWLKCIFGTTIQDIDSALPVEMDTYRAKMKTYYSRLLDMVKDYRPPEQKLENRELYYFTALFFLTLDQPLFHTTEMSSLRDRVLDFLLDLNINDGSFFSELSIPYIAEDGTKKYKNLSMNDALAIAKNHSNPKMHQKFLTAGS